MESIHRRIFRESFPYDFVGETLRLLINTYKLVWADLERRYPLPEGYGEIHDLFPHELRGQFNYEWRKLAGRYAGIVGRSLTNSTGGAYHTEIVSKQAVLEVEAVETPKSMRRFKRVSYRQDLVKACQLNMFEKTEHQGVDAEDLDNKLLYGVLLHGFPQSRSPGFAFVGFPKQDATGYEDVINLFHYYPEVLKLYEEPVEPEQELDIRLKPSALEESEDQESG